MKIYPLKFKPIFKERIWGGDKLKTFFGKAIPKDIKIGESWELADLPDDKSIVTNGPLAGETIDKIIERFGSDITGQDNYKPPFGLLIKILDAQDDLSLQVHPDIETCRRTGKGDPKTECWYIIEAQDDAAIYKGLKPDVTKEQFRQAIEDGTTADLLEKIIVSAGECHFLPAGLVHAIGKGLLVAEIQTPSDTTYRVFDWNRTDSNGKSRQLHIDDAMESINFDMPKENVTIKKSGRLIDCDFFKVDKYQQKSDTCQEFSAGKMRAVVIIKGDGQINCKDTNVDFSAGDTLLMPAVCQCQIKSQIDCEYLIATI